MSILLWFLLSFLFKIITEEWIVNILISQRLIFREGCHRSQHFFQDSSTFLLFHSYYWVDIMSSFSTIKWVLLLLFTEQPTYVSIGPILLIFKWTLERSTVDAVRNITQLIARICVNLPTRPTSANEKRMTSKPSNFSRRGRITLEGKWFAASPGISSDFWNLINRNSQAELGDVGPGNSFLIYCNPRHCKARQWRKFLPPTNWLKKKRLR